MDTHSWHLHDAIATPLAQTPTVFIKEIKLEKGEPIPYPRLPHLHHFKKTVR
jgi:hypothetical protein